MAEKANAKRWGIGWFVVAVRLLYVITSGPVLAIAFYLREATGWNGFYGVMWLYFPLLMSRPGSPIRVYLDWWVVNVFHTVGPG